MERTRVDLGIHSDATAAVFLGLLASAVRVLYCHLQAVPAFDPWRHLALIRNVRDGLGFSLFDGQPYIWYTPYWHAFCALFPESLSPEWIAAGMSIATVLLWYWWLRSPALRMPTPVATLASTVLALFGPLVSFTCHYGPESMALFLLVLALAASAWYPSAPTTIFVGIAAGIAVMTRINLALSLVLFWRLLKAPRRLAAFAAGFCVPVAIAWVTNGRVIASNPFVFVFDGIAVDATSFNTLTSIFLQGNTTVSDALLALHAKIMRSPEWLPVPQSPASYAPVVAVSTLVAATALSRQWHYLGAAAAGILYFGLLDRTHSGYFFRVFLGIIPVLAAGVAHFMASNGAARTGPALRAIVLALVLIGGAQHLVPSRTLPIDAVLPPNELITAESMMMNGGFYQPESVIYRYPNVRIIGLPLRERDFERFKACYPGIDYILWHDFSIQDSVVSRALTSGEFHITRTGANSWHRQYAVLSRNALHTPSDRNHLQNALDSSSTGLQNQD